MCSVKVWRLLCGERACELTQKWFCIYSEDRRTLTRICHFIHKGKGSQMRSISTHQAKQLVNRPRTRKTFYLSSFRCKQHINICTSCASRKSQAFHRKEEEPKILTGLTGPQNPPGDFLLSWTSPVWAHLEKGRLQCGSAGPAGSAEWHPSLCLGHMISWGSLCWDCAFSSVSCAWWNQVGHLADVLRSISGLSKVCVTIFEARSYG